MYASPQAKTTIGELTVAAQGSSRCQQKHWEASKRWPRRQPARQSWRAVPANLTGNAKRSEADHSPWEASNGAERQVCSLTWKLASGGKVYPSATDEAIKL